MPLLLSTVSPKKSKAPMYASLAVAAPKPSPAIIAALIGAIAAGPIVGAVAAAVGTPAATAPATAPTVSATSGPTSAKSLKVKGIGIPNNLFSSSKRVIFPVFGSS